MPAREDVTLMEALADIEARFIIPLPASELRPERVFFHLEQAHWFYEDFYRDSHTHLQHFKQLKAFALLFIAFCSKLKHLESKAEHYYNQFVAYRSSVPVCGCIMLNSSMTKVVLANNWAGTSWNFPRGKINEGESLLECGVRETYEETGYSPRALCNEDDVIVVKEPGSNKTFNMFIAVGVPEDTHFEPQTRKEVSEVAFFDLNNLPPKTWGVAPFLNQLRRWIRKRQSELASGRASLRVPMSAVYPTSQSAPVPVLPPPPPLSKKAQKKALKAAAKAAAKSESLALAFNSRNSDTFGTSVGGAGGTWGVKDMFDANAKLTGRTFDYDGNPHNFGDSHPRYTRFEGAAVSVYGDDNAILRDGNFESLNAASEAFQRSGKIQDPRGKPLKAPVNPDFAVRDNREKHGVSIGITALGNEQSAMSASRLDTGVKTEQGVSLSAPRSSSAPVPQASVPISPSKARAIQEQDKEVERVNEILDFLKLTNVLHFKSASDPDYASASKCTSKQRRLYKKVKQLGGYLISSDRLKQLLVDEDSHTAPSSSKPVSNTKRSQTGVGKPLGNPSDSSQRKSIGDDFMGKLEASDSKWKSGIDGYSSADQTRFGFVLSASAHPVVDNCLFLDAKALVLDVDEALKKNEFRW